MQEASVIRKLLFIIFILTNSLYSEDKIIESMKPVNYNEDYSFDFLKDFFGEDGNFTQNFKIKIYCDNNLISLGKVTIERSQTTLSPIEFIQSKKIKVIDNNISTSNELYQLIAQGVIDNISETSVVETNFIFDKKKNLFFDKTENEIYTYFGFKKTNSYIDKKRNKIYKTKLYAIENYFCFEHQELNLNKNTTLEHYSCNNRKIQNLMPIIQTFIYSDLEIKLVIEGIDNLEQQKNKKENNINIVENPIKIIANKKCTMVTFLSDYKEYLKERKKLINLNKKELIKELDKDFKKKINNCPIAIDYMKQQAKKYQKYLE